MMMVLLAIYACKDQLKNFTNSQNLSEDVKVSEVTENSCHENSQGLRFIPKSLIICHFSKIDSESTYKLISASETNELSLKHPVKWIHKLNGKIFCLSFMAFEKYDDHENKYYEVKAIKVDGIAPVEGEKNNKELGCEFADSKNNQFKEMNPENIESQRGIEKFYRILEGQEVENLVTYSVQNNSDNTDLDDVCQKNLNSNL